MFSAQFHPADVEHVRAHRDTYPAETKPYGTWPERTVYYVGASLRHAHMVTLAGEDPAAIRVLLTSMLAALDAIDPAKGAPVGSKVSVDIPEHYDQPVPWTAITDPDTPEEVETSQGGEAA